MTINDQVQGGSSSYRHNLHLLKLFGFEVTPVEMKIRCVIANQTHSHLSTIPHQLWAGEQPLDEHCTQSTDRLLQTRNQAVWSAPETNRILGGGLYLPAHSICARLGGVLFKISK